MKYRVTWYESTGMGREDHVFEIEADRYERDGRTYTFYRGNDPIGTYENVTQVALAEGS